MKIVELDYKNIHLLKEDISLCLGYFDGVHRGHRKLILEAKRNSKYKVALLTFDKPVSIYLDNNKSKEVLTSSEDKIRIIKRIDIDYYFIVRIDKVFLSYSPLDFINKILSKLNIKEIYVGSDYRFGKEAKGNPDLLKEHFDVYIVDLLTRDGKKISTSNIIKNIKNGNIIDANKDLGHNYQMMGKIVEGNHIGNSIGFPTANVQLSTNYVIPKFGVYKVIAYISGIPHLAIANIGIHPTVSELSSPLLEVHIPSYEGDDYNKSIYVEFLDFLRPEKKFSNVEELKAQIKSDVESLKR